LNGDFTYPNGQTANQLVMLTQIGMFDTPLAVDAPEAATLTALPSLEGSADTEDKARAILHVNCAMCHQADGPGGGDSDLLYSTALEEMNICGELPVFGDLDVSDPRIVTPGDADKSILSLRMHALDVHRMPPLSSSVVDQSGTEIIDAWIEGMTSTADGDNPDCSW
jgi:hypothetical protein